MNKLLAISIASASASASASIAIGAIPALAELDPKIHALCLEAKDYSGCVQTQTSLSSNTEATPIDSTEGEPIYTTPWQEHLDENPTLKIWVEANPALGRERKKKWLSENQTYLDPELSNLDTEEIIGLDNGCPEHCYFSPTHGQCSAFTNAGIVPCSEKSKHPDYKYGGHRNASSSCPPGKRQYTKTHLFGLIKGAKLCLTDYEVESLRQGERNRTDKAVKNFTDSMNKLNESMQPQQQVIIQQPLLQPVQPPRVINCHSNTYGHYTSTSCY